MDALIVMLKNVIVFVLLAIPSNFFAFFLLCRRKRPHFAGDIARVRETRREYGFARAREKTPT